MGIFGFTGGARYPHESRPDIMPTDNFPDDLETGEPPKRERLEEGNFDEDKFLHEIEAGITPELRGEAIDFVADIDDMALSKKEYGHLLAYVLSVLAQSPERNAEKRLQLARRAADEMVKKIDRMRSEQEKAEQTAETAHNDETRSLQRGPNRVLGGEDDPGKYFPKGSRRNFGRKPKYKDHGRNLK